MQTFSSEIFVLSEKSIEPVMLNVNIAIAYIPFVHLKGGLSPYISAILE
jgi:hypothetical protein